MFTTYLQGTIGICIRLTLSCYFGIQSMLSFVNCFTSLSKSDLNCCVSYEMFLISYPLAAMEGSSVYMCFPCYQEFNTLEEVLKHQLTCTAEDEQAEASGATAVTVPVLQTQVKTGTAIVSISLHRVTVAGCSVTLVTPRAEQYQYSDGLACERQPCDRAKASELYS